jgi:crossover junction endonuclease MUS81
MEFIVDNRENIHQQLSDNVKITLKNMDVGDYLFNYNDIPVLIIERKTIEDYASSIKDGRYREQKERLINNYPLDKILYLVEGDLTKNNCSFRFNKVSKYNIYSSIINCLLRDNIKVFHTKDKNETVDFLLNIYKKIEKQGVDFINDVNLQQDNLIQSIKPKKKDNYDNETIYLSQMCCINGISISYAKAIASQFPNIKDFIVELSKTEKEDRIKQISEIKSITKTGKTRKIGKKLATKINDYFFDDEPSK